MIRIALSMLLVLSIIQTNAQPYNWTRLTAAPYNGGKQDGISFINPDTGWSVNGDGKIYRTYDGGVTWTNLLTQAGTYFRCISFINKDVGFAGNIGTDYFPGVTDPVPFYKTTNGGVTWLPVTYSGPTVKGLCAIDYVATPFINAGILDTNYTIYAAGRVGGPAYMLKSADNGSSWTSIDLSAWIGMVTDVKFISKDTGFVFGGTNGDITASNAKIIYTTNGGSSFTSVYQSSRTNEMIWKGAIPRRKVGYATILSYATTTQRYVSKTTDGGLTWTEIPLANNSCSEFGVGFVNDSTGWVGTDGTGFQTLDAGATWTPKNIGQYANKIQIVYSKYGFTGYAIGLNIYKMDSFTRVAINDPKFIAASSVDLKAFPNPGSRFVNLQYHLDEPQKVRLEVYDMTGRKLDEFTSDMQEAGDQLHPYSFNNISARIVCFVLTTKVGQSKIRVNLQP